MTVTEPLGAPDLAEERATRVALVLARMKTDYDDITN